MFWKNILALDEKTTASLRIHEHQKWIRPIGVFFAHSGDSWFILLVLILVWFFTRGLLASIVSTISRSSFDTGDSGAGNQIPNQASAT